MPTTTEHESTAASAAAGEVTTWPSDLSAIADQSAPSASATSGALTSPGPSPSRLPPPPPPPPSTFGGDDNSGGCDAVVAAIVATVDGLSAAGEGGTQREEAGPEEGEDSADGWALQPLTVAGVACAGPAGALPVALDATELALRRAWRRVEDLECERELYANYVRAHKRSGRDPVRERLDALRRKHGADFDVRLVAVVRRTQQKQMKPEPRA